MLAARKAKMSDNVKKANRNAYGISNTNPVGGKFWKFCDTFLTSTKNQTVYNPVLKKRKRNLTAVIFHFVVAVQEHNRRVQLRTYALPNQFQKRLNSSFSIDQEMIFAKI